MAMLNESVQPRGKLKASQIEYLKIRWDTEAICTTTFKGTFVRKIFYHM